MYSILKKFPSGFSDQTICMPACTSVFSPATDVTSSFPPTFKLPSVSFSRKGISRYPTFNSMSRLFHPAGLDRSKFVKDDWHRGLNLVNVVINGFSRWLKHWRRQQFRTKQIHIQLFDVAVRWLLGTQPRWDWFKTARDHSMIRLHSRYIHVTFTYFDIGCDARGASCYKQIKYVISSSWIMDVLTEIETSQERR